MIPGHWVNCINPFNNLVNHSYFQHIPPKMNELAKICPVCWYVAGSKPPVTVPGPLKHDRSNISKPEKDSL